MLLSKCEWNLLVPLPKAAEMLGISQEDLLFYIAMFEKIIEKDHPVFQKKYPVFLYFSHEEYDTPIPVPITGKNDSANKVFLFELADLGKAELPPPFSPARDVVELKEARLMAYVVQRVRDLLVANAEAVDPPNNGGIVYDTPQNRLAMMCNVDPRTISNWTGRGLLCEKRGREKLYSLPLVAEWLEKNGKHKELESLNNPK